MSWLEADCNACEALCCRLPFARSADFAHDKPSGVACHHLEGPRCSIHPALRARGYAGCTVFDCFGAGQALVRSGRQVDVHDLMALRHVHQVAWLLREASQFRLPRPLERDVGRMFGEIREGGGDVDAAVALLRRVSLAVRSRSDGPKEELAGADQLGADLRQRDLRGANLRGALLVGARLEGVDLAGADLTGADLRGARLHGADLSRALWVHDSQLRSATGDGETRLAIRSSRPLHWEA